MIDRRTFLTTLGLAATARAADTGRRTRYYSMQSFLLKQGTQGARLHDWIRAALPKLGAGPKIVLDAVVAPHSPQILLIMGFPSFEEMSAVQAKLYAESPENGADPLFESQNVALLEAAPYSPEIAAEKHEKPRYFELRTYRSPSRPQLAGLHERFAGPEIKIFHRVGIHPLFYSSTLIGANVPNLVYLIPFDSLAAREQAWNAFGVDPDWAKARKESIDKYGQLNSVNDISIFRAAPYSPIS